MEISNSNRPPSLTTYRQYAADPNNEGTFVSTSQTGVTTAPKSFFGHTISFFTAKSNAQEVETLNQSLEQNLGPYVARFAFPHAEQEQAATSYWGGCVQQVANKTLASALNPTLRGINVNLSLTESRGEASRAMPFYQRQIRPLIQSAVRELNPSLQNINLDVSLPTATPSVGLSHRLIKQVLERADAVTQDADYIKQAAETTDNIVSTLEYLDEKFCPSSEKMRGINNNLSGLARDISHHASSAAPTSIRSSNKLSSLLTKANTAIPETTKKAQLLLSETTALATALQELSKEHDYYELGNDAPLNLTTYDFQQFMEPVTALLTEEATLAEHVVEHLGTSPTSAHKEARLEEYLNQNDGIARELEKSSQQVSQLKGKLKNQLNALSAKAEKRLTTAKEAIAHPTISRSIYATMILGRSWEEERQAAQEELDFCEQANSILITAEKKAAPWEIWKNIPEAVAIDPIPQVVEAIPVAEIDRKA